MRLAVVGAVLLIAIVGCADASAPLAVPSSGPCAGIPLIDHNNPPDSLPLTPDPVLEQKLPTQIDGQPVTDVSSGRYIETLCMLGGDASLVAAARNSPVGVDISDVNVASGKATVDGVAATIGAYRLPGQSGASLIPVIGLLAGAVTGQSRFEVGLTPATIGNKAVQSWTNAADGVTSYLYSNGDTLFVVDDVTPSQAGKILAALP
jgi:hypothetical protein